MENNMTTIAYTCAPKEADYGYVETLEEFDHEKHGKTRHWRKIKIVTDSYRTKYQLMRYTSFLGGTASSIDPREHDYPNDALREIFGV